ncbi:MAG: phage minor head protein [Bacteroidia bacterium]|nr:phage minor head protein [Bacteroidia bacterium]
MRCTGILANLPKTKPTQALVHQTQAEAIAWQDKEKVKNWLNKIIFPYLKLNYTFDWVQQDALPLTEQWKIHKEMLELGLPVDTEYLSQKYNTPFTKTQPDAEPTTNKTQPKNQKNKSKFVQQKKTNPLDLGYPPTEPTFWQKALKSIRKFLFKNDLDDVQKLLQLQPEQAVSLLFEHYKNTFLKAIDKGFKNPNWGNLEGYRFLQLQENAYRFSYAKAHYVLEVIKNAADDRKAGMYKVLHENYTLTEANHFTTSARMAKKWIQIQESKEEFPYLQYVTAHDDHVRPAHKALDGVIKPVDDPFWNTHYPPNGYNCRCTVKKLSQLPEDYQDKPIDVQPENELFDNNPGITGIAFKDTHRYFREAVNSIKEYETIVSRIIRTDAANTLKKGFNFFSQNLKKTVEVSKNSIKEMLNQPHNRYNVKNLMLPHIEKIVEQLVYYKSVPPKDKDVGYVEKVVYYHLPLLTNSVSDTKFYFIFKLYKKEKKQRTRKSKHAEIIKLYSISQNEPKMKD